MAQQGSEESVEAALARVSSALRAVGIPSPRGDAQILVAHATGLTRQGLLLENTRPLSQKESQRLAQLVTRRTLQRESIAHILGSRGFRYLDLAVDQRVLIPRPETELLVEVGLKLPDAATVIDVGTGSGAVALALKQERPDLIVHATDVSSQALEVAQENARRLDLSVEFHQGDLLQPLPVDLLGAVDAVLSNPPYIPDSDLESLPPEVALHDPHLALFGGRDGLDIVRRLVLEVAESSAKLIALEIGQGQSAETAEIISASGFAHVECLADLAGIERVVLGRRGT